MNEHHLDLVFACFVLNLSHICLCDLSRHPKNKEPKRPNRHSDQSTIWNKAGSAWP